MLTNSSLHIFTIESDNITLSPNIGHKLSSDVERHILGKYRPQITAAKACFTKYLRIKCIYF